MQEAANSERHLPDLNFELTYVINSDQLWDLSRTNSNNL